MKKNIILIMLFIFICILMKIFAFPCLLADTGDGEIIEIKKLSVRVQFPSGYPPAEFKDKSRLRKGELIEVGLYKTSNGNGNIDGPGMKQFSFLYGRCPQELGCSLEEEVNDFVASQEDHGAKVLKRIDREIVGKNAVEMILTRNVNNAPIFHKTVFIFHQGYVLNYYVLVQSIDDLTSSSVKSFFNSLQFEEK